MRVTLFGAVFRVPLPLILSTAVLSVAFQRDVFSPISALLVHELGHVIAARAMGVRIAEVRVCPLGASMRLELCDDLATTVVSLCGPAASLAAATTAICAADVFPALAFLEGFATYSLVLAAFNMLPAMPLDGGRILKDALSGVLSQKILRYVLLFTGLAVVFVLFLMSCAYYPEIHWSMLAITVFTVYGCIGEFRSQTVAPVSRVLKNELALSSSGSINMKTVGFLQTVRACDALARLKGAGFIAVVDESSRLLGAMTEGDLLWGMIQLGPDSQMIEILRQKRGFKYFPKE